MSIVIKPTEQGTAFLTTPVTESAEKIFTLEERDEDQRLMEESAATFATREILPNVDAIDRQEPGVMPGLLKKAGEQGLLMIEVPEEYEGANLGLLTSALVASRFREASFATAYSAHCSIGTLPIVYYGNEAQKQRYLPKLASGEWLSSYALTEPGVGSDAMNLSARAELSKDGKYYILNGTKQWITNAGFADVIVAFARIGNERPSAFIVEATYPGVSTGPEEHKMGIKGSSTRQVIFEDAKVPVENLLGEIHKGYKIAFNILNIGRLKLGAAAVGGARNALNLAAAYTTERKSMGKYLHEFGMIKKKLAHMAAETYAAESHAFRTAANMTNAQHSRTDTESMFEAIEEYALEASIAKVHCSEVFSFAVDEGVQIFGGYGFMQEYPIEKAYRDARIQRIFEGTNEINRMVAVNTLFRRVLKGKVDLLPIYPEIENRIKTGQALDHAGQSVPAELRDPVNALERAKDAVIYTTLQIALEYIKNPQALENEQEFMDYLANLMIELYSVDSALARAIKAVRSGNADSSTHVKLAQLATWLSFTRIHGYLDQLIMTYVQEQRMSRVLERVRTYLGDYVFNGVAAQREIAALVVAKQGYPL